jgi:hypothetical protein
MPRRLGKDTTESQVAPTRQRQKPELEYWLEIVDNEPTAEEKVNACLLAEGTGYPVFVFVGLPSVGDPAKPIGFAAQGREWVEGWVWQQCDLCGSVALTHGKEGWCLACHEGATIEDARPLIAAVTLHELRGSRIPEPNGIELSCPAEAGKLPVVLTYAGWPGAPPCAPARRGSFSELLGGRSGLGSHSVWQPPPIPRLAGPAEWHRRQDQVAPPV